MGKIFFISEMKSPVSNRASSTTIMVNNMIMGLKNRGHFMELIALGNPIDEEEIYAYYSSRVDKVTFLKSRFGTEGITKKYQTLIKEFWNWLFPFYIKKAAKNFLIQDGDTVITHSPSSESIIVAKMLLKGKKQRYIQFWSDPMTLSGIYPEEIGMKRRIIYFLEYICLSRTKEIVYGTKTLMNFQKKLFPALSKRMRYVDISYNWNLEPEVHSPKAKEKTKFGYFGNYYSNIRDIYPLYQAFQNINVAAELVVCGSSDINLTMESNIEVLDRISPQEAETLENTVDIIVCILNKNCIQIPGKLFYKTCLNKIILVVLDGKYQDVIKQDLEQYGRFVFCNNKVEELRKIIQQICASDILYEKYKCGISSVEMADQLLKND